MDFSKVKLRKTEVLEKKVDFQAMQNELQNQRKQLEHVNNKVREADLEAWYPTLKNFTYKTQYVPISMEEGRAMIRLYDARMKGLFLGEEENLIKGVIQRLQMVMDEFKDGAFVKLSSRSAKDASAASERTKNIFKSLLADVRNPTDNQKLIAINRAHIMALCLKDAKEVVDMFLNSERINSDFELAINFPSQWNQHFLVREYVPIPIEFEFRGFVVNKALRGLCQYYHYLFFPVLVEKKDQILDLIMKKFEEIKDIVPIEDGTYVVDWAVDLENQKVYIIEINPFGDYEGMGTSAAMFHLHDNIVTMDRQGPDRNLFFGDGKFEFRIETQEADGEKLWNLMHGPWKRLFYEMFGGPSKKT